MTTTRNRANVKVYTPPARAKAMADELLHTAGDYPLTTIYDPCCGEGALLDPFEGFKTQGTDIDSRALDRALEQGHAVSPGDLFDCFHKLPDDVGVICNPPYAGVPQMRQILTGERFAWLKKTYKTARAERADLAAFVLRHVLEHQQPVVSTWVTTSSIAQGGSRRVGLKWALANGYVMTSFKGDIPWGEAGAHVIVCVFTLVDTRRIPKPHKYNSFGKSRPERDDPQPLASNVGLAFQGKRYRKGLILTPQEREQLVKKNRKNGELIFPLIGGKEVNTSPTQDFHRYVINFGARTLEEAKAWPDLLDIVRDRNKQAVHWWWRGAAQNSLDKAIQGLPRCLVNAQVSKHLVYAFQPTNRVLASKLYVYPLPEYAHFTLLQSRIHEAWARYLSSTLKDSLSYAISDCFENFPFPTDTPRTPIPALEPIGQQVYEARAAYMQSNEQGLTKLYNALKDPAVNNNAVLRLRELHIEMDHQVLKAYGWDDIDVPPFTENCQKFTDEIMDRLYLLNASRKDEE